ncbi:DUF4097 family beta strand repeat-containing protein [Niallia sp. 03133]|uniref:DUF4097 family beta strand repeat-containing protein n=1 Tax=Niallia sp. 03133 TaxID=3458060 RepID=UPI00404481A1
MINIKRISVIALILVVIGMIGSILTFRLMDKSVTVAEEKTFENNNIAAIKVDSDNTRVEIMPTKEKVAKVELSGRGSKETKKSFSANVEGNKLVVQLKDEQFKLISLDFLSESLTLKIYLPEKQFKSMDINNDNGYVQLSDLKVDQLEAETNNGRVELQNISSKNVEVESDNGRLVLDHVSGKIKAKTNNGKISIKTADLNRPMQLETDNGSIEVETEKEPSNVSFDVHVDNGSINILDKYEGNAVIGDGDNLIKLKTNNGRITVTK